MILGDGAIRQMVKENQLITDIPSGEVLINPASVNVRLGNTFLIPAHHGIFSLGDKIEYERKYVGDNDLYILAPGAFCLATTKEGVALPANLAAFVQGRSSIGRVGLQVQNAGFVDPGFFGHITLELKNDSPYEISLRPGYPVAQLVFIDAVHVTMPYNGKYNGQVEATGSRMYQDKEAQGRREDSV